MKPMGTAPPRSKETDRIKAEIWAEQCDQRNKPPMPKEVYADQMGTYADFDDCLAVLACCECGEPFALGAGFVADGSYDKYWCEPCFRKMAWEKYGVK